MPLTCICPLSRPFSRCPQPVLEATRPGFLGNVQRPCADVRSAPSRTRSVPADCGPLGVFCSNWDHKRPSPSLFYAPPASARIPAEPVLLTPALSPACDFSTATWVWAVLGTCIFLFFGTLAESCHVLFLLYRADLLRSVTVRWPRLYSPVPQAQNSASHAQQPGAAGAVRAAAFRPAAEGRGCCRAW
jgi:hypothetical protein